jgi:hypothetical protein
MALQRLRKWSLNVRSGECNTNGNVPFVYESSVTAAKQSDIRRSYFSIYAFLNANNRDSHGIVINYDYELGGLPSTRLGMPV